MCRHRLDDTRRLRVGELAGMMILRSDSLDDGRPALIGPLARVGLFDWGLFTLDDPDLLNPTWLDVVAIL